MENKTAVMIPKKNVSICAWAFRIASVDVVAVLVLAPPSEKIVVNRSGIKQRRSMRLTPPPLGTSERNGSGVLLDDKKKKIFCQTGVS